MKKQNCYNFERKDRTIIIVKDFNISLSIIDRNISQKTSKYIDLNNTINQLELIDIYRSLYPGTAEYIFFKVNVKHLLRWIVC